MGTTDVSAPCSSSENVRSYPQDVLVAPKKRAVSALLKGLKSGQVSKVVEGMEAASGPGAAAFRYGKVVATGETGVILEHDAEDVNDLVWKLAFAGNRVDWFGAEA